MKMKIAKERAGRTETRRQGGDASPRIVNPINIGASRLAPPLFRLQLLAGSFHTLKGRGDQLSENLFFFLYTVHIQRERERE